MMMVVVVVVLGLLARGVDPRSRKRTRLDSRGTGRVIGHITCTLTT